jgi:hypothetical protein
MKLTLAERQALDRAAAPPDDPPPPRVDPNGFMTPEYSRWQWRQAERRLNGGRGRSPNPGPSRLQQLEIEEFRLDAEVDRVQRRKTDLEVRLTGLRRGVRARLGKPPAEVAETEAALAAAAVELIDLRARHDGALRRLAEAEAAEEARRTGDEERGVFSSPDGRRAAFSQTVILDGKRL